jgi:hypothetical protein
MPFSAYGFHVHVIAGIAGAFGLVALCALALATLAHLFRENRNANSCPLFLAIMVGAYSAWCPWPLSIATPMVNDRTVTGKLSH